MFESSDTQINIIAFFMNGCFNLLRVVTGQEIYSKQLLNTYSDENKTY